MAEHGSSGTDRELGDTVPPGPKRFPDWFKVTIQGALIAAISASLSFCDSFGFGKAASEQTHATFQVLQSAFYGSDRQRVPGNENEPHLNAGCEPLETRSGDVTYYSGACVDRNRVRVISFTKPEMMKVGWPIPYSKLQKLFENAKSENARAVFVDLIVSLQRDNEGGIADHDEFCQFAAELGRLTGLASGRREDGYSDWYTAVFRDIEPSDRSVPTKIRETKANPDAIRGRGCISRAVLYELKQSSKLMHGAEVGTSVLDILRDNSYLQHQPIARYVPSAVRAKRGSAAMARIRSREGLPILLGVDLPYLRNDERPEFPSVGANGVSMNTGQVSLWKLWILDQVAVLSTIRAGAASGKGYRLRIDTDSYFSPALRLFSDVECAGPELSAACRQSESPPPMPGGVTHQLPDTLYLSWGGFSNGSQTKARQSDAIDTACPSDSLGTVTFVKRLVFGALAGTSVGRCLQRQSQPYHDSDTFSAAIEPLKIGLVGGSTDEARAAFSGSYLFLGIDADVLGDRISVPMHGTIPAVNTHAMAFDNLLSPNAKLKFLGEEKLWDEVSAALHFLSVLLASLVFFYWQRKNFPLKRLLANLFMRFSRVMGGLLAFLFLGGSAVALYLVLRNFELGVVADLFAVFAASLVLVVSCIALYGEYRDRAIHLQFGPYSVRTQFHQGFRDLAPHGVALLVVSAVVVSMVALYTWASNVPPSESFAIFVGMSGSYMFVFRDEMHEALKDFGVLAP